MNQKQSLFTITWWKKGFASAIIGVVLIALTMAFIVGFIHLVDISFYKARSRMVTDVVADGSAVAGSSKNRFDTDKANSSASQLINYNSIHDDSYSALLNVSEDRTIIWGKKTYVVDTAVSSAQAGSNRATVIVLPKQAHPLARAALTQALNIADDERYGYGNYIWYDGGSWDPTWEYDCGRFVCLAYNTVGIGILYNAWGSNRDVYIPGYGTIHIDGGELVVNSYMSMFNALGFEYMPFTSADDLLEGDILISYNGGHTEMYAGEQFGIHYTVGAHTNSSDDGKTHTSGDDTGSEINKIPMRSGWKHVFRYVGFD